MEISVADEKISQKVGETRGPFNKWCWNNWRSTGKKITPQINLSLLLLLSHLSRVRLCETP